MPNTYQNQNIIPVAVDAMGGDHGPEVVVAGAVKAARDLGIPVIIVGKEEEIRTCLIKLKANNEPLISVENANDVITMEDTPSRALRAKSNASIRVAFELVKSNKACAVVSPGNTGAMMAAGLFVSGALPGIVRPAIATLLPKVGDKLPTVFLDSGANIDSNAHQLVQFALMGDFYARVGLSCPNPRIALLSNGSEPSKGTDVIRAAALSLSENKDLNYIGYVEGRDISKDVADVVVCDGFVGNVLLKSIEGSVELVIDSVKHELESRLLAKFGFWLAKPLLKAVFGDKLNPSSYGGAPLLGLRDIGIVCHGSAKDLAIFNAIRVARKLVDENLVEKMSQALGVLDLSRSGVYENGMWNRMEARFSNSSKKESVLETKVPEANVRTNLSSKEE